MAKPGRSFSDVVPAPIRLLLLVAFAALPLVLWFVPAWLFKDALFLGYVVFATTWVLASVFRTYKVQLKPEYRWKLWLHVQWHPTHSVAWSLPGMRNARIVRWAWA